MSYQDRLYEEGPENRDNRPRREYSRVTIEKFEGKHYLIASNVFDLSEGGRCLTEDEIQKLPVNPCYTGPELTYKTNEKEAFAILMKILANANRMQDPDFYSFSLGK